MKTHKDSLPYLMWSQQKVVLLKYIDVLAEYLHGIKIEQQQKLDALISMKIPEKRIGKFLHIRKITRARNALIKSPLSIRAIRKNEHVRIIAKLMQFNSARVDLFAKKITIALQNRYADSETIAEALRQFTSLYSIPEIRVPHSRKQLKLNHQ